MLRFTEHFFCGSRYWFSGIKICGGFWEIGNSYGSNKKALETLRFNNKEVLFVKDLEYLLRVMKSSSL